MPRLLDLFAGAGGAARGYQQAGFHVTGVDVNPSPRYGGDEFVQADVFDLSILWMKRFDAIHASPPCQGYSRLRHLPWLKGKNYPRLIEPTRALLYVVGLPWIIENVEDAPLAKQADFFGAHGITLCGTMFDLPGQYRHRRFEANFPIGAPEHPHHSFVMAPGNASLSKRYPGRYAGITSWQEAGGVAGHFGNKEQAQRSMGIDWMTTDELRQAIPPAMTRFLGSELLSHLSTALSPGGN